MGRSGRGKGGAERETDLPEGFVLCFPIASFQDGASFVRALWCVSTNGNLIYVGNGSNWHVMP